MRTLCTRHRHHHRRHGNFLSRCKLGIVLGKICYHLIRNSTKCYLLTFLGDFYRPFSPAKYCSGQEAVKCRIENHTTREDTLQLHSTMMLTTKIIPLPITKDIWQCRTMYITVIAGAYIRVYRQSIRSDV